MRDAGASVLPDSAEDFTFGQTLNPALARPPQHRRFRARVDRTSDRCARVLQDEQRFPRRIVVGESSARWPGSTPNRAA